jgi:predicted  nucleic acid-binding Zn-ribbon protein
MEELYRSLLQLQEMDREIAGAEQRLAEFGPKLESVEAPVLALERELETLRAQIAELREHARRLERGAEEKQERLRRYRERLERVRNAREEAAAWTELDLVRRAAEADEQEALEVMERVTRTELKVDELERELAKVRAEVEPKKEALQLERADAEAALAILRDRRENHAQRLAPEALRLYERVRAGNTKVALAQLLPDGACGYCFSMVPIQQQVEIRRGESLRRCEACGVILYPSE